MRIRPGTDGRALEALGGVGESRTDEIGTDYIYVIELSIKKTSAALGWLGLGPHRPPCGAHAVRSKRLVVWGSYTDCAEKARFFAGVAARATPLSGQARRELQRSFVPKGLFVLEIVLKGGKDLSWSIPMWMCFPRTLAARTGAK